MTFVAGIIFGIVLCAMSHTCKTRRFVRLASGLHIAIASVESIGQAPSGATTVRSISGCAYHIDMSGPTPETYEQIIERFEKAMNE